MTRLIQYERPAGAQSIRLDVNALPVGHDRAELEAAGALMRYVNELPESVYHLGYDDARFVTTRVVLAYLDALKEQQR